MASQLASEVFLALCKQVNTPVALGSWLRFKYDQKQLAELNINPLDYNSVDSFQSDYLVTSFLRKYKGLDTGIDTKNEALLAFAGFEAQCASTNRVFRDPYLRGLTPRVHSVLHGMSRKISSVLGPLDVPALLDRCKWGNGATASLSRRHATVDKKIRELPLSVTPRALPYIKAVIEADPVWFEAISGIRPDAQYSVLPRSFSVTLGDKLDVVDKDATTGRTIGKTPTANSFLQQGPGRYIRHRLKRFGIDLDNQEINQSWAELALDYDLVTLDLKGASDTIATNMVYHVLPLEWAEFLDALRSPFYQVSKKLGGDGTWFRSEKFSAMGTAFTFELESLIFYAVLSACEEYLGTSGIVSVYGDDLICPRSSAPLVKEVLQALGFTVNMKKSHVNGYFRESCGKHYFNGYDVSPLYQKEIIEESNPISLIRAGNRLYRYSSKPGNIRAKAADATWNTLHVLRRLAPDWLLTYRIPDTEVSDDGWLTPFWEFNSFDENHGFYCQVLTPRVLTREGHGTALYAYTLRRMARKDLDPLRHLFPLESIDASSVNVGVTKILYQESWRWVAPHAVI